MGSDEQPQWMQVTPDIWTLVNDEGIILRQVARRGPYLGQAAPTFTVTGGPGEATEHATLAEAMAAAEAALT